MGPIQGPASSRLCLPAKQTYLSKQILRAPHWTIVYFVLPGCSSGFHLRPHHVLVHNETVVFPLMQKSHGMGRPLPPDLLYDYNRDSGSVG
ncbi:hypothetical protein AAFF_G00432520 [Aldrovandia affinis]|uniref:Uncharacterized protein n=1 Tax=Aldrovandia affinis TaxID=143900 RepID=A0AAD7WIH9_9TELE|nr:hypothetical protein AAFF_G00432520 [Aldrovandia affinis]